MLFKKKLNQKAETVALEFGGNNDSIRKFAFVLNIEDVDNELKIVLSSYVEEEMGTEIDDTLDEKVKEILKDSTPIYPNKDDCYEIIFPNYIIYQVRNESYCSWDDYEIRHGKRLILFEKSRLLDYLTTVTDCEQFGDGDFFPGEWKHYGIYAEDHVIDVISHEKPVIRKLTKEHACRFI